MSKNKNNKNICVSLTFIERLLGIGLSMMIEEVQKERMNRVVKSVSDGTATIDGSVFAALIDECRNVIWLMIDEVFQVE